VFEYGKAEVHWPERSICNECSEKIKFIKDKTILYYYTHCALNPASPFIAGGARGSGENGKFLSGLYP